MFSHCCVRQIQIPISKNSILQNVVPLMYAYCSNYACLFVCDCSITKIVLQDAETVYSFSVSLYTSKLIFCAGIAHLLFIVSVKISLFVFHRLVVPSIDVLTILSFVIFPFFLLLATNDRMYIVH